MECGEALLISATVTPINGWTRAVASKVDGIDGLCIDYDIVICFVYGLCHFKLTGGSG